MLLQRFRRDFNTDVVDGIAGQALPPALFLYQTGGAYASDEQAIPMAQLDLALAEPGVFLATPVYPVTSKGGHLDANGYRWLGAQFGKVMHRVLTRGEAWLPLHPRRIVASGRTVMISFHVPAPPLAWGRPFAGHRAVDVPERGFTALDEAGPIGIEQVALAGPDAVALTLARAPGAGAALRYADTTRHGGRGALHDSDATVADDTYEYDATTGHYPTADIADLVGRPYPLQNWCVAFNLPIEPA
jgi:hypothetical protein